MELKKMKKFPILIFILILVLLPSVVYARPVADAAFDSLRGGLSQIHNFFAGQQYQPYAKAIDFFFFSFLFIAIYMMGARYAFKEIKRPEQVIVILLGLMTAFLLVLANISVVALLPFIQWIFYILLFILYWWLLKGIKNPFWRFILALLLTLLTIGLIQGLFDTLSKPQIGTIGAPDTSGFGFGNFFKNWGNNFGTIGIPKFTTPGISGVSDWGNNLFGAAQTTPSLTGPITPTTTPPGTTQIPPTTPQQNPPAQGRGLSSWLLPLLLLALLAGGGFLGYKNRDKLKNWRGWFRRRKDTATATTAQEDENARHQREKEEIEKLIEEIETIILLKKKILAQIAEIIERKKKATLAFWEVYHKKINDPAFLMDPDSDEHKNLMSEQDEVTQLLRLELALEKDLIELRRLEEELITLKGIGTIREELDIRGAKKGKVLEWGAKISDIYAKTPQAFMAAPEWYIGALGKISKSLMILDPIVMRILSLPNRFPSLRNSVPKKGLVQEVIDSIMTHFLLTKKQEEIERKLRKLTNLKQVEEWLKEGKYERWMDLQNKEANELKKYFEQQERIFYETIPELDAADELVFDADNKVVFKSKGTLMPLINKQMRYLQLLIQLLKFLESDRQSFTQLQELNVAVQNPNNQTKWDDVNPDFYIDSRTNARVAPANINQEEMQFYWRGYIILSGQTIKVFTNFAEGIPPFKIACYVDNTKRAEQTANVKYAIEPVVKFLTIPNPNAPNPSETEIGEMTQGTHIISVLAISPRDTYKRASKRTIVIDVGVPGGRAPPGPSPGEPTSTHVRLTKPNDGEEFYANDIIEFEATTDFEITDNKDYLYTISRIEAKGKRQRITSGFATSNIISKELPANYKNLGPGKHKIMFMLIKKVGNDPSEYHNSQEIKITINKKTRKKSKTPPAPPPTGPRAIRGLLSAGTPPKGSRVRNLFSRGNRTDIGTIEARRLETGTEGRFLDIGRGIVPAPTGPTEFGREEPSRKLEATAPVQKIEIIKINGTKDIRDHSGYIMVDIEAGLPIKIEGTVYGTGDIIVGCWYMPVGGNPEKDSTIRYITLRSVKDTANFEYETENALEPREYIFRVMANTPNGTMKTKSEQARINILQKIPSPSGTKSRREELRRKLAASGTASKVKVEAVSPRRRTFLE